MLVRDLMGTSRFRVIHRDTLVCEAAGVLDSEKIGGAPLVDDDGEVVGLITKSDIVHFEFVGGDAAVARAWEVGRTRVKCVRDDVTAKAAAKIMLDAHIHRLLVVDEEGGPIGMLTSSDYMRHVAES